MLAEGPPIPSMQVIVNVVVWTKLLVKTDPFELPELEKPLSPIIEQSVALAVLQYSVVCPLSPTVVGVE